MREAREMNLTELRRVVELPHKFPKIICLCGSTRFANVFHQEAWDLTLQGYIVLSIGVCKHTEDHGGESLGQDVEDRLDELHLRKIDLADIVAILNVNGYIGESTRKELNYARTLGKHVVFLENEIADRATGESDDAR